MRQTAGEMGGRRGVYEELKQFISEASTVCEMASIGSLMGA